MSKINKNVPRDTPDQATLRKVGRALRIKRNDLNLKILDVEKKSGVSSVTISKLEKGQLLNCSLETISKIAGAVGARIELLIIDKST